MEKEAFWWHSADSKPPPSFSSGAAADQLPPHCFFNLNWKQQQQQSMTHDGDLESALSSLVSSPSSHPVAADAAADGAVIGELIGRLGTICNPGEISPASQHRSADASCHSTPLNSPPKLNLSLMDLRQHAGMGLPIPANPIPGAHFMPFSADPWFAEAAERFSRCGGMSPSGFAGQFGLPETPGKLSRVSSSKSMKASTGSRMGAPENRNDAASILGAAQLELETRSKFGGLSTPEESELGNGQEESSVSDRITAEASSLRGVPDKNARKRKATAKGKGKEAPLSYSATNLPNVSAENSAAKRCRPADPENDTEKMKTEKSGDTDRNQGKDSGTKLPEPPKDYIHVRARRGQATDAHSLAERVRREKISKRMKFLQDLVPGCNKVTGKAVMLDEIINYVQSLQRQVEFLSMKLATLNPQLDHVENLIPKEMYQAHGLLPQPVYTGSTVFSCPQATTLQSIISSGLEAQFSQNVQVAQLDAFADATSQLGEFWEDDLQSVAQTGFPQNQDTASPSQSFRGQMQANQMKIEL